MSWRKRLYAALLARLSAVYEPLVADRKRALFADLGGDVLEIGPGTGPNLLFCSAAARYIGIEPNPYMEPYLRQAAERQGMRIEFRNGAAERIELDDGSVDAVVGTLVLCSVRDPAKALGEILRVLRPGGRFLFLEHVAAARGTRRRRIQDWARPVWTLLADGCHPNRETWAWIEQAGFQSVSYERFELPLGMLASHIAGVAVKSGGATAAAGGSALVSSRP